jgi:hypothetical protein
MTIAILSLATGFIFISVLLLLLNLRTDYHWSIKAGMIGIASLFYLITLSTLPAFYGWPTLDPLPQKFRLLAHDIHEPANETDKGAIYIWISSLDADQAHPRAYQLPYDPELHSRLTAAQKRIEFGHTVAGEISADDDDKRGSDDLPRFHFIERPKLPPKKN